MVFASKNSRYVEWDKLRLVIELVPEFVATARR
jgi:hypothetical protein